MISRVSTVVYIKKNFLFFQNQSLSRRSSGIGVCEVEDGVSIGAASSGRNVAVKIKKTSRRKNKSTIGVMSIRGVFTASLIFPIISQFVFSSKSVEAKYKKNYFKVEANVCVRLKLASSI